MSAPVATVSITAPVIPEVHAEFYRLARAQGRKPAHVMRELVEAWIAAQESQS